MTVSIPTSDICISPGLLIATHTSKEEHKPNLGNIEEIPVRKNTTEQDKTESSSPFSGNTMAPSHTGKEDLDTSRLKEVILSSAREEAKIQRRRFFLGSQSKEGREKRKQWIKVERELHNAQGLGSWSVQSTPLKVQLQMLSYLREAILEAVFYLIEGTPLFRDVTGSDPNPFRLKIPSKTDNKNLFQSFILASRSSKSLQERKYYVWSSPQVARCAIVRDAIDAYSYRTESKGVLNSRPLVVLVVEPSSENTADSNAETDICPASTQNQFISEWTRASCGVAEVITVVTESAEKMTKAISDVLSSASKESLFSPVLVCLYAPGDSVLASNTSSVRKICDSFRALLCIEGSSLAMIAQPDRPSGPEESANHANILIIDPGSWLGFKMCAVLTRHELRPGLRGEAGKLQGSAGSSFLAFSDNDDKQGVSTGPVLNLWVLLSRVGVENMRSRIDNITALAERFVHIFEKSTNVHAVYDGIGCVIRISYVLSREDRLMTKKKALENKSLVNSILFEELENESKALTVYKVNVENATCLQFAPTRLLSSGTFWIPSQEDIESYAERIQETVDKYESCLAGSVSFEGRMAKCKDLSPVSVGEGGKCLALCFGAVRVVPHELCTSWRETSSSIDIVRVLTYRLVCELQESLGDIISKSFLLQRELEQSGLCSALKGERIKEPAEEPLDVHGGTDDTIHKTQKANNRVFGLPFIVYFNTDMESGIPDFLSVEPKESCRPVQAVRQGALAAELLISAVEAITSEWRSTNMISQIPRDLANVAGKEDFIPLTAPRDALGCVNLVNPNRNGGAFIPVKGSQRGNGKCNPTGPERNENGGNSVEQIESQDDEFFSVQSEMSCTELVVDNFFASTSSSGCTSPKPGTTTDAVMEPLAACSSDICMPNTNLRFQRDRTVERELHDSKPHLVQRGLNFEEHSREEHDAIRAMKTGQVRKRSHWLGLWGTESHRMPPSSGTNRSEEDGRQARHGQGNTEREENRQEGSKAERVLSGDSSPSSNSEDESEDRTDDEDESDQETDETSAKTGSEEDVTESSGESSADNGGILRTVRSSQKPAKNGSPLRGASGDGFFTWFWKNEAKHAVAEPAQSCVEQPNDSHSVSCNSDTELSEVPSDWVSRRQDDWESNGWGSASSADGEMLEDEEDQAEKESTKLEEQSITGPSVFGFAWLCRRYLGTSIPVRPDEDLPNKSEGDYRSCSENESRRESIHVSEGARGNNQIVSSSSRASSVGSDENNESTANESYCTEQSEKERSDSSHDAGYDTERSSDVSRDDSEVYDLSECSSTEGDNSSSYEGEGESNSQEGSGSDSDSETDDNPGKERVSAESKSRVGRYLYWLAPRWVSGTGHSASPDVKRREERRGLQYVESSSESDDAHGYEARNQRMRTVRATRTGRHR